MQEMLIVSILFRPVAITNVVIDGYLLKNYIHISSAQKTLCF